MWVQRSYCIAMFVRLLPLIAALAPILGANLAYWLGVRADVLPSCIQYFDGCTSISAAGRYPPGSYLFRAVHLPYAALLSVVWYFNYLWLTAVEGQAHRLRRRVMFGFGLVGSLALIVYVTFLGTSEPIYEFMRRGGIYFYFLSTAIAQVATTLALLHIDKRVFAWMLVTSLLPFALGIDNLVQKEVLPFEIADLVENQIEWIAALTMHVWFIVLYAAWRRQGFEVSVTATKTDRTSATR
ncbi:MAG: hypothetical protein R3358_12080 [Woeseiaceae bacterium]|nr:hypothetical protein [Woeseiaceae bacterium]